MLCCVLFISLTILPAIVQAQFGDPNPPDPDAPIDGGISLLVAAGIGYGAKKARDSRKKKKAQLQ
jgi:hypothetical protein